MPRKTISFELDFMIKDIFPRFTVKQFDDVSFNIKPKNQGLNYDTTGMTGKIFVGVDNDMFMQTTGITVSSDNINVILDKNMLQKSGRAYAEIELTDSHGTITSSSFIFNIDEKIGEGAKIPEGYEGFVAKYERLISEFKSQVNSTISNCNSNVNSAIKQCNASVDSKLNTVDSLVNAKISDLENRFNRLTSSQQQSAEVIDARDGEASLNARLERDLAKGKEIYSQVEGKYISTDSNDGYLKDIEIKGNTIQDADNLADIRSVGEKVEGQELYEIPILSYGKNLFNINNIQRCVYIHSITGEIRPVGDTTTPGVTDFIKVKPNTTYVIKCETDRITRFGEYTKDKTFISRTDTKKITTSNDTCYIRAQVDFSTLNEIQNIQLEEGTVATEYEPYQEDKITILSPCQIEKVGDVADRIVEKDGVWGVEKNNGSKTINVNDVTVIKISDANGKNRYKFPITNLIPDKNIVQETANKNIISSIAKPSSWSAMYNGTETGVCTTDADIVFCLDNVPTIDDFKLLINNCKLIYKLATPTFIPLPHDQQVVLRTFANKTNISFLTEIEGTIKAQVPKSLGATVNTHTTQIDNLNKELDRVKKLEESTVSTVETESDFTVVEQTSNGYFEDVKLEGRTLVNRFDTKNINVSYPNGLNKTQGNKFGISISQGTTMVATRFEITFNETINFKDKTFAFNVLTPQVNGLQLYLYGESDIQLADYKKEACVNFTKYYTNDLLVKKIRLYVNRELSLSESDTVYMQNVMLLEGDHTQNPPSYFEGLKSVGDDTDEIVVSSVNVNRFCSSPYYRIPTISEKEVDIPNTNITIVKNGGDTQNILFTSDAIERLDTTGASYGQSHKIKVRNLKPNSEYEISYTVDFTESTYVWCGLLDEGRNDIPVSSNHTRITRTRMSNYLGEIEGYMFVSDAWIKYSNIEIKLKESSVTDYTPCQSDKKQLLFYNTETQTWEKPVLREWDSIEKHSDGKYYYHQRSGEVVIDNNSDIVARGSGVENGTNNLYSYGVTVTEVISNDSNAINTINNRFNDIKFNDAYYLKKSGVSVSNITNSKAIVIISECSTIVALKNDLSKRSLTVVYKLAQEKVYECTNIDLITYEGETNYIVESGAISPKSTLKVHNNISNVVSLLQKKVSLLESNITNYMITQNRLQLASTYSADSVTFKVDYYAMYNNEAEEYNNDLYDLILNNILVGKDNYDYDKMFNIILDYASWNQISWEQFDILVGLMDMQHNPPIEELPTEDEIEEDIIEEETPVE